MEESSLNIDYVANLARLDISEADKPRFKQQLLNILNHFEQLEAIDTTGIEPLAHPFPVVNVWQEDEPSATLSTQEALQNAPQIKDHQVVVPKVVE